ncbi:MAG TPA: UDP-2,3-diacylglucosamine diphosphatase LpxI [Gammaproteobacteria bacterium]|nr:UDP-2,3-diacylglucosamine diphosphatase LpxI [Gammaproteobacteria bacterium]
MTPTPSGRPTSPRGGASAATEAAAGDPPIGLIAGYGRFPLLYARNLKAQGYRVFCAAIREETDPAVTEVADEHRWLRLGQLGKLIEAFRGAGVREAVMAGKVHKTRIYQLRPDLRAVKLMARAPDFKDDTLLGAVADELGRSGIRLVSSIAHAGELLPGSGVLTRRAPSGEERADIDFGWDLAKVVAGQDVGQSVVIKNRSVMAVEAIEGTDAAIRRGGELGGGGVTVVKVAKPGQDVRFDVPTIGTDTVVAMAEAGATCLALEAGLTLVLDRDEVVAAADAAGISIILLEAPAESGRGDNSS